MSPFERGFHVGVWSGIAVFAVGLVAGGLLAGCGPTAPATPPAKDYSYLWRDSAKPPSSATVNLWAGGDTAKPGQAPDSQIIMRFDVSKWPDENMEHCEKEEKLLDWIAYEFHFCAPANYVPGSVSHPYAPVNKDDKVAEWRDLK
jgi:hypothetical protein